MKRTDQILLLILAAAVFFYIVLVDYPALKRNLPSAEDATNEAVSQEDSDSEQSDRSADQEDSTAEEIPATQTVLVTGSIQKAIYTDVYPGFQDANHTGTLLFTDSHLTGDSGQMVTADFQEMVDAGWGYAMGGIDSDLSTEDWKSSLEEEAEEIRQRTGESPSVYYFQAGEYQAEREAVLSEEGFSALYYAVEDAENVNTDNAGIKRICTITISAESDLQEILNQAWSYECIAICLTADSGDASTAGQWSTLLTALDGDERFSVVGQSDWLDRTQEYDADRADKVAAALKAEAE